MTSLTVWYLTLEAFLAAGDYLGVYYHVTLVARIGWLLGYFALSWLFWESVKTNNLERTDPRAVIIVTGPYAMLGVGFFLSGWIPLLWLVMGYALIIHFSSNYAGGFANRKREGNTLEFFATCVFPHVVLWEDRYLVKLQEANEKN